MKNTTIILIILIVIVLGGGIFFLMDLAQTKEAEKVVETLATKDKYTEEAKKEAVKFYKKGLNLKQLKRLNEIFGKGEKATAEEIKEAEDLIKLAFEKNGKKINS